MTSTDEEMRLLNVYQQRDKEMPWNNWHVNIYHPRHPLGSLLQEYNRRLLVRTLNTLEIPLENSKILDVGCGVGYWLRYFVELGALPGNITGVDTSVDRLEAARAKNPAIRWLQHGGATLPFADRSFDIVLQAFLFSSVLDPCYRQACAAEINRVLADNGILLWLDLRRSNSKLLTGFTEQEVLSLFPNTCVLHRERCHPSFLRRICKHTWLARFIYCLPNINCESDFIVIARAP